MQDTSTQPSHIQHLRSCSKVNNRQTTEEKGPPDKHLEVNNASTEEASLLFTWGKLNNNKFTNHVNNI